MKFPRHILGFVLGLGVAFQALAQNGQPVVTSPSSVGTVHADGTIAATGTFQSVFAAAGHMAKPSLPVRQGCLIQNTGSNTQYVYFGPIASATQASAFQLAPPSTGSQGGSISCSTLGGSVLQDQVSITGTIGDSFVAEHQ
jgi:hypothetical protein